MAVAETGELRASPELSAAPFGSRVALFCIRAYWLWPSLLMLVCASVGLNGPSLWADELATWGSVRIGWGQLFHMVDNVDAVVAPYYVVMKAWTSLAGTSDVALRVPSVLAMTAAAGLVAVLGARLHSQWVGLVAGLVFAVVPGTSRYAQEARPYSFVILMAVVATLLLTRLLERPGFGTGVCYAVSVAVLGAFHVVGLLLLLAHAVAARHRRSTWATWAGTGLLPVLPLLWLGYRQRHQISWIPLARLHDILGTPDIIFVSAGSGGAVLGLGLLAFSRRSNSVLLASWGLIPVAALALAGQVTSLFYARYLLFVLPAWALLAALTLNRVRRVQALAVVVIIAVLGAPTQSAIRDPDGHATASSAGGRIIATNERPGDAIAYKLDDTAPWAARDVVARYVPADRQPLDVFEVLPPRVDGRLAATECADLTACLDRANPPRMWIVRKDAHPDPLHGMGAKGALLRSRYHLFRLWLVKGLTVALYTRS